MNEQQILLRSDQVRRYVNTTAYWDGYANIFMYNSENGIYHLLAVDRWGVDIANLTT